MVFFFRIASCSDFGEVERQFPPIFVSGYSYTVLPFQFVLENAGSTSNFMPSNLLSVTDVLHLKVTLS